MVSNFHLPPTGFGPGSQPAPEDGTELAYMELPQNMRSYSMHVPDAPEEADVSAALELLEKIADAAGLVAIDGGRARFDLGRLDAANRRLMAETLGHGEVAMRLHGIPAVAVQESVFAGVWVLKGADVDAVEVAAVPREAGARAALPRRVATGPRTALTPGVVNAPPLAVELFDRSATWTPEAEIHVVNLTLLPHTEEDLAWLDAALGQGSTEILSRGYGNCRITSTALPQVWRVQFFNSMDTLILDTFEVTAMPETAIAAPEDLADSARRIRAVAEAIR
ncbi:hydrogenase expression/formation protein [Poseidonocella sp. HB161398]|uniref:hydrogenase expression/formation protein n=1 Tax=Poseidonocella sp. HB161398 TaxID=2320855 RepID=UPI001109B336|nr:hydrogenase expression/formation protein [Poseidonocella sp. HB161398]